MRARHSKAADNIGCAKTVCKNCVATAVVHLYVQCNVALACFCSRYDLKWNGPMALEIFSLSVLCHALTLVGLQL